MRYAASLAVISLYLVVAATILGCSAQRPVEPDLGQNDQGLTARQMDGRDEGAWQTVDLLSVSSSAQGESDPSGQLRYLLSGPLVFQGEIHMRDLLPDYEYLLAIVGKPDMPGRPQEYYNAGVIFYDYDAPEPYTGRPTQPGGSRGGGEYCDFALVITNQHGSVGESFAVALPAGTYEVSFAVKDAHMWSHYAETGNFDTEILYHDTVNFEITTYLQKVGR